jgi:2-polyprenyl-3-methyl-5-hydroxy-6-metoxy-1,4-benzoquinol methylase
MSIATLKLSATSTPPQTKAENTVAAPLSRHRCRHCNTPLHNIFVDLGASPLCETYLTADQLDEPEPFYPLCVYLCETCLLVQLPAYVTGEHIFSEYAYFSSFSTSYLDHARQNVESLIKQFQLDSKNFVVEVASNDGYLLRNFVSHNIPCLGIEPATNIARAAQQHGIPTLNKFFGQQTAREVAAQHQRADLVVANNVLAHVPDIHDFIAGLKILLADQGVGVVEIQYLLRLMERNQFDTIYQEHYCYFTLHSLITVLAAHGLAIFDAEEIATHGGSIRIYFTHAENTAQQENPRVADLLAAERSASLHQPTGYIGFTEKVTEVKRALLEFLINAKRNGQTIAGYGAPGKGNTLLNYCGIRGDFLDYTVDRNTYKQGRFLPGSRIPIYAPERIAQTKPDYVLILPWNLREEISQQLDYIRAWDGKFVVPIPHLEIW